MRTIADTIARLSALKQHPLRNPGNDRLDDLTRFGSNPGALRARTYVPDELPESAALVVVLHGCTQTAAAYDYGSGWSTLADRHGFVLLFPEQQRPNNSNLCFNWFSPEDNRRGSGEAFSICQMIERMVSLHGLDPRRIFVTGLSAGGAMAGVMLAAYPEVFAGGAVIAGLPYGSAQTIPEAFDRMRGHGGPTEGELSALVRNASSHSGPWPTISVWHGSADLTVAPSNASDIVSQWLGVHFFSGVTPRTQALGARHKRRTWAGPDGRAVVEENIIAGMGHGTPLRIGPDGCGAAGPYMIDVAVSSSQDIADFWGLMDYAQKTESVPREEILLPVPSVQTLRYHHGARKERQHGKAAHTPGAAASAGVRKVIEDALRAAGLMT